MSENTDKKAEVKNIFLKTISPIINNTISSIIMLFIYMLLTLFLLTEFYPLHFSTTIHLFIVFLSFSITSYYKRYSFLINGFFLFISFGISGYLAYFKIPFNFTVFQYVGLSQGFLFTAIKIVLDLFTRETLYATMALGFIGIVHQYCVPISKKRLKYTLACGILIFCALFYNSHIQNTKNPMPPFKTISNKKSSDKDSANVLVIVIESFTSSITKLKIDNKFVMPYYNELRSEAIYFPYLSSVGGATFEKEAALFNLNNKSISIPKIYSKNSYETTYVHNGAEIFYDRKKIFSQRHNFSKMIFENNIPQSNNNSYLAISGGKNPLYMMAKESDMFNYLETALPFKEPFFMHILTITGHFPFVLNSDLYNYYPKMSMNETNNQGLYEYSIKSMAYIDDLLSKFIPRVLEENPNTHILILGDTSVTHPKLAAPHLATEAILIPSKMSSMNIQTNNLVISHAELGLLMLNIANVDFSVSTYIENIHEAIIKNEKITPTLPIIRDFDSRISAEERLELVTVIEKHNKTFTQNAHKELNTNK